MRLTIFFIAALFYLPSFGQTGKLDIKLKLTKADTTYPYFLDSWVMKEDSTILRIEITNSGLHHFGSFKQGVYHLELNDHRARGISIDSIKIFSDSVTTLAISYPGLCKFIYPSNFKPVCPKGHSDNIVRIVYGFPTDKTMKKAKKGLIHLGGCIITDCDPQYYCTIHRIEL